MIVSYLRPAVTPFLKDNTFESRAFPFFVDIATVPNLSSVHWHDYTQLWYTVSGSYEHTINGVTTTHTAGSLALILPYTIHSVDTTKSDFKKLKLIRLSIYEDLFTKNIMPFRTISYKSAVFDNFILNPLLKLNGKDKASADILFNDILSEFSRHHEMNQKSIFSNISKIFELLVHSKAIPVSRSLLTKTSESLDIISDAAEFITRNSSENIQLSKIAKQSLMSQRTFSRNFAFFTGQTYISYYNKVKMKNVMSRLLYTTKSLSEIADECGFYDATHLSHFFKNAIQISPSTFRSKMIDYNRNHGLSDHLRHMERLKWMNVLSPEEIEYFRKCAVGIPQR